MRLINVETLELEEFFSEPPAYAILSHTWGAEEVTLQQWQSPSHPISLAGYDKVILAVRQAQADGLKFIWCDTCCIDKTSSAELSEAINSMFAWYRDAVVCYAFLADVSDATGVHKDPEDAETLSKSRWFTRGWTLQELLAPSEVRFYDSTWAFMGTRMTMANTISKITGIAVHYLKGKSKFTTIFGIPADELEGSPLFHASVAERMSWLSRRATTRVEDMAYCVLGIFDVNIPLLYGEGTKAFFRLQEELVRVSNDATIFCWTWSSEYCPGNWDSILAPSPAAFRDSGLYNPILVDKDGTTSYSISNNGLTASFLTISMNFAECVFVVPWTWSIDDPRARIVIPLLRQSGTGLWVRPSYPGSPLYLLPEDIKGREFQKKQYVVRTRLEQGSRRAEPLIGTNPDKHAVLLLFNDDEHLGLVEGYPGRWERKRGTLWLESRQHNGTFMSTAIMTAKYRIEPKCRFCIFFAARETMPGQHRFFCKAIEVPVEPFNELAKWQALMEDQRRQIDAGEGTLFAEAEAALTAPGSLMTRSSCQTSWGAVRMGSQSEQFVDVEGSVVQAVFISVDPGRAGKSLQGTRTSDTQIRRAPSCTLL